MICITGAAGYIGSHTASHLAERGVALRAFVRPTAAPEELDYLRSLEAEIVFGQADDPEVMAKALAGCRAVIHCVGGIQPPRPGDFSSLHEGPAEALAAAALRAGLERVVLVSAIGTRPGSDTAYHRTKALAEDILRSKVETTTIIRPSLVYGRAGGLRDSKLMVRLATFLRSGRALPLPGGGRALVQPLFVGDLARALALSAAEGVAEGQTLDVGGPERMTLRAWVELVAATLGARPRLLPLPQAVAQAVAAAAERFMASPPITVDQVRVMGHNFTAPLDGVQAAFGFAPTTPSEGLKRTYGSTANPE